MLETLETHVLILNICAQAVLEHIQEVKDAHSM
jgi:hypothetical protein